MRKKILTTLGVLALAGAASYWTAAGVTVSAADVGPQMSSIGPLTFGPDGVLFAADTQAATIYALELGDKANGGAPGTQAVDAHRPEDRRRCSAPTPRRSPSPTWWCIRARGTPTSP